MIYGGHRTLMPHPRPVRRKTSALEGYYRNGIPVTTVNVGDTIVYDVPGPYSPGQVWLVQTVNGQPSYNGPYAIPQPPYTLNINDKPGTYYNTVYTKSPSAGGTVIETDSAVLLAPAGSPYTAPPGSAPSTSCPPGYVSKSGGCYPPAVPPTVITPTAPPVPVTPTGTTTTPTGTTTTTTTTTTGTTSTGGGGTASGGGGFVGGGGGAGGGGAQPAPDNTLLIVGLAALAFVMLAK